MTGYQNTSKTIGYFAVGLLVVSLLAGCSAEVITQAKAEPEAGLSSAGRLSPEVARPATSGEVKPKNQAMQVPPPKQAEAQVNVVTPIPSDPAMDANAAPEFETGAQPPAPLASQGSQPLPPPPPVDLSIPVGLQVGLRAPDFTLQAMDGKQYRLSEIAGQPVLINYWATWCIPCKAELPILQKLYQEYQPKGLVILTVDAIEQDSADNVQGIISQFGLTFPVLLDHGGQFAGLYQAIFFPTTLLVDASGVIREINLGDSTEVELRASLDKMLAGGF